jgi:outer membrane protein OmpA-like peptidoglycan-associated protein
MRKLFKMHKLLATTIVLLGYSMAKANVCGTDFQNFNPTTSGLDFVTTQSSETLKPCIINMGLFFNYAENSLTYSNSLNANFPRGQKRKDKIVGADLSLGMGLTDRWDVGFNVPLVLSQTVQDDYYVASFSQTGISEVKMNTKFRFYGDESGGVAAILSFNKNLIEDNPFTGKDPGLTWNYELAADTTFLSKWAAGINAGYRQRNPGSAIPNVPFVPMKDQWIYSVAGSYLFSQIDTKLILELYGSRPANAVDQDTDRSLSSLEALAGLKHDVSQNLALHFGLARQIDSALGGAEWRAYAGMNWAVGAFCKAEPVKVVEPSAESAGQDIAKKAPEVDHYKLDVELLFDFGSGKSDKNKLARLDGFFTDLTSKGFQKIVISGHTDSLGAPAYNQDLSEKRAESVRQYLIEKFKIPSEKIEAIGYGSSQPISDNGNYQGRRNNRRVDVQIWHTK